MSATRATAAAGTSRVLVACVGNLLRGDDGFGPAMAQRLGDLPDGAELVETGIGGVALLQELLAGCDALVLVDAVDRGDEPGTVSAIVPDVRDAPHVADVHLANPQRVLSMAKTMGVLPDRVLIVGCQPERVDELEQVLSPAVQQALGVAERRVREAVDGWL